jgi:hypothetical protein
VASKCYSYTNAQAIDVSLQFHSGVRWRRDAFRMWQQEYFGCWSTAANARFGCKN